MTNGSKKCPYWPIPADVSVHHTFFYRPTDTIKIHFFQILSYSVTIAGNNPFLLMSWFNLDFRESKPMFLSPQFHLNHGQDNLHYESCCGSSLPETSENPTQSSLFTKWELYASLHYCVMRVMRQHQQQNGYPNNKEVYNTCVIVCVFTHTHVALALS